MLTKTVWNSICHFYENKATEDPAIIANAFNDFFVNEASKKKEHITPSNHNKLKDFYKFQIMINLKISVQANILKTHNLQFQLSTKKRFGDTCPLSNVDVRRATDTDNIGTRLLKLAATHIAEDITFICNSSINSNCFPEKWKV